MRRTCALIFSLALSTALLAPPGAAAPLAHGAASQCPREDTPIRKQIRFARGRTTAVIKDTVRLCTSHEYYLRARRGQRMSVHLVAGDRTSFSLYAPTEPLDDADGVKDWEGDLPESGQYQITVGTDATARYTLEVTIR